MRQSCCALHDDGLEEEDGDEEAKAGLFRLKAGKRRRTSQPTSAPKAASSSARRKRRRKGRLVR